MMPEAPFDPLASKNAQPLADSDESAAVNEPETTETRTNISSARAQHRGASDPLFGFIIAAALSVGLTPLLPESVELRYTLAWGALAGVSVLSWLLGTMERIDQERPDNLGWGVLYGLLLGIPFLVFLSQNVLGPAAGRLFPSMTAGGLLAFLVFVMPLAETLFFRGLLQGQLLSWIVGLLATLWNIVLFFPVMWQSITEHQAVALVIAILLLITNMLYAYVRDRNGLASAWICQIVCNLIIFYLPSL